MSSSDNNFENSLDSALNMSQEEIERLLNGQGMIEDNAPEYETADLESLLSELEAMDDGDIQEISDLLDKAENNEAADSEIIDLLNMQEELDDAPAYDAMDLFSAEGEAVSKESFLKRLLAKFKKKDKEVEEESSSEKKEKHKEKRTKEKKIKEKKKKGKNKEQKEVATDEGQQSTEEPAQLDILDDTLNGSDAIILELEKEEVEKEEARIKEKPKKKDKAKKKDKTPKKEKKDSEASEDDEEKKKPKKEKKKKEKRVKEKSIVLYDYTEEPLTKKKVSIVFFICLMLMFAIIALLVNYAGHANRRLAEDAYDEGDYLQCYQLLYGQHLNESQEVMFHQSKIHLKMESLWNRYRSLTAEKQYLRSLDKLIQFVFEYPQINEYATEWNCEDVVDETYRDVLDLLYDEYKLQEKDAISIANIEDDVEYTKTLTVLVEKKEKGMLKYPNMLPEEEDRIGDLEE